jgi:hypothetical protein
MLANTRAELELRFKSSGLASCIQGLAGDLEQMICTNVKLFCIKLIPSVS